MFKIFLQYVHNAMQFPDMFIMLQFSLSQSPGEPRVQDISKIGKTSLANFK